jgi:hypothetical protein
MLALDCLMFLEPFGLLPIVPLPDTLRQFIPAYKATRIIGEVLIEALPQFLMQAVIFVLVSEHVANGTANAVDMSLYTLNGGSFVSLLPKSILISSITMLKTWYELVQEASFMGSDSPRHLSCSALYVVARMTSALPASSCVIAAWQAREAGIGVGLKAKQLWNVGYGLPLDAIKKNSIYTWKCKYEISDLEIVSLVDALSKNESLAHLDLSLAGFEWMPPVKREERSALTTLLEAINQDAKALEGLEKLRIRPTNDWLVPVGALRSGPETVRNSTRVGMCVRAWCSFHSVSGGVTRANVRRRSKRSTRCRTCC